MRYKLADDAKPQVTLLLTATGVSVALWFISWYVPLVGYVVYPLQLFATFIHESCHALMTLVSGNSVKSLTVSPNGSGMVWSEAPWFSSMLISSAGYLGATAFGTLLLVWMRFGYSSRLALYILSGLVAVMTVVFGLLAPFWNFLQNVTFFSVVFTVFSGALLSAGLFAIGKFAKSKWVNFALAFLAVQCLLNAFFSLKDLFLISAGSIGTNVPNDAANMAAATGIPTLIWVFLWIVISLAMMVLGLRLYAVGKGAKSADSVFED